MKQTPLGKAIAELEYAIKSATEVMHEKSGTDEAVMMGLVMFQQNFLKYLQSLLPYEREAVEGAYNSGYYKGADREEFKDDNYFTSTYTQ